MNELALFAGAGGGILGGHLLGWRTRCAVEFDPYARAVLLARQRDGCLPRFPIWDDVRTFDGNPWRGHVDVVSGGFPCQDISAAGKGAGIDGERSGLWREMARIIGEVRPAYAWVENSPMLVGRGLAVVLGDLAEMGYDARWGIVGADDAGAAHGRKRIWILAHAAGWRRPARSTGCGQEEGGRTRREADGSGCQMANPESTRASEDFGWIRSRACGACDGKGSSCERSVEAVGTGEAVADALRNGGSPRLPESKQREEGQPGEPVNSGAGRTSPRGWWDSEPDMGRMADGMAPAMDIHGTNAAGNVARVGVRISKRADRLRCIGNGQVPAALVLAWRILNEP